MTTFELYILLVLPQIRDALLAISVIAAIGVGIAAFIFTLASYIGYAYNDSDEAMQARKTGFKLWKTLGWLTLPILVSVFLPTTKIMLALIGWELGTSIEGIENLPASMVDYLNTMLEIEIADLKEGVESAADVVENATQE